MNHGTELEPGNDDGPVSGAVLRRTHLVVLGGQGRLDWTVRRFCKLIPPMRMRVVTAGEAAARAQLAGYEDIRILEQPGDRGTAGGLLLAILETAGRDPDALCVVTHADQPHEEEPLLEAISDASVRLQGAHFADVIVLLGAEAASQEHFGWVVGGELHESTGLVRVRCFEDKPRATRAWSSVAMVGAARAFIHLYETHLPELLGALLPLLWLEHGWRRDFVARSYPALEPHDVSRHLLAAADNLLLSVLPAAAGWEATPRTS